MNFRLLKFKVEISTRNCLIDRVEQLMVNTKNSYLGSPGWIETNSETIYCGRRELKSAYTFFMKAMYTLD